jgi:hypothetical protein
MEKYKFKLRILYVRTPSYQNKDYIKTKEKFEKNLKRFHKRYVKMITKVDKKKDFKIKLVGFDGKVKKKYRKLSITKVFEDIDKMPMGHLRKKLKPINQSLYADYNKLTSNKGFGFANKEKALDTIKKLKKEKIKYQVYVVTTMLGRAKSHPHQTQGMRDAIKIFKKWLIDYKKYKN